MEVGFCGDYNGLLLRLSYDKRTEDVKGVNAQDYLHAGFLALTAIHIAPRYVDIVVRPCFDPCRRQCQSRQLSHHRSLFPHCS
jgi:hypothetical protein